MGRIILLIILMNSCSLSKTDKKDDEIELDLNVASQASLFQSQGYYENMMLKKDPVFVSIKGHKCITNWAEIYRKNNLT